MVDLLEKENINLINSHHKVDNLRESILKRVIHIHPKDYNFIVKDGNPSSVKQAAEIKLEEDSDESNLKGSSFEKSSEFQILFSTKFYRFFKHLCSSFHKRWLEG